MVGNMKHHAHRYNDTVAQGPAALREAFGPRLYPFAEAGSAGWNALENALAVFNENSPMMRDY